MQYPHDTSPPRRLKFGHWTLDAQRMELSDGQAVVSLQPLVLALLEHFLNNPGRVIGKGELLESVWRSPFVTDSAVVRAVMKLRKIIGNSVTTVHGVGYRFDAVVTEVREPEKAPSEHPPSKGTGLAGPVAVLKIVDERPRVTTNGTGEGLACWLHFVCEQAQIGPLLPMVSVLAWSPAEERSVDVSAACKALGAGSAIGCRLREEAGLTVVDASWGGADGEIQHRRFEDSNVSKAMLQWVRALGGTPSDAMAGSEWPEELIQAFILERQGKEVQALESLNSLKLRPGQQGVLRLMHVRLLRKGGLCNAAAESALGALDASGSTPTLLVRARLLVELAEVHILQADYGGAMARCEQAMALIESDPSTEAALSEVLLTMARVAFPMGDTSSAIRLSSRALEAATAEGDQAGAISARLWLANMLTAEGRHSEAIHHAHIAVKAAANTDMPGLQGSGYNVLGSIHGMRREHATAVNFARKALAFCFMSGDRLSSMRARLNEFANLISASRLSEAEAAWQAMKSDQTISDQPARFMAVYHAKLSWRLGRYDSAVAELEALLHKFIELGSSYRWDIGAELFQCQLSLGRRAEATRVLALCHDDPQEWRRLCREADFALFDGDRQHCVKVLRRIWTRFATSGPYAIDSALNLAWLLLEDDAIEGQSSFWRHICAVSPEHECARLVQHRYRIATGVLSLDPEAWRKDVLGIPGLALRHPWLAEPDALTAVAPGSSRKLPELASQACW